MRKNIISVITIVLMLCNFLPVFAQEENSTEAIQEPFVEQISQTEEEEPQQDLSQPRFMVTDYKLSTGSIKPSEKATLSITFKNYSKTKALYNIKFTVSDESGELKIQGMPSKYVECIGTGKSYTWEIVLETSSNAQIGEHKLLVNAEYEDIYYNPYSSSDMVSVNVVQSVMLDYDGLMLPVKVVQGDTQTVSVKLMNTGKTDLRNCKIDFNIEGIDSSGTLFIGEIIAGQSADGSLNLRVGKDALGEVKGTAVITYEDAYGDEHTEEVELSTVIEEKVEMTDSADDNEKESKNPLWWLFFVLGLAIGGGIGAAIPIIIFRTKQRKEDELRL